MIAPLLTPATLMTVLDVAQPALTQPEGGQCSGFERGRYEEAFRSFAALARADDDAARFKLATLYYTADDDVRAALWSLIIGAPANEETCRAAA